MHSLKYHSPGAGTPSVLFGYGADFRGSSGSINAKLDSPEYRDARSEQGCRD